MKNRKLLWLLLIAITIVAALAFTVSAADNASEPALKIEAGNLSFEDSVFILYAVSHEGIDAKDVRLYFWNEPQSGENAYAYDTADYSFALYQLNETVAGKSCVTFRNNTLRAKNMTDYVYARAYAEVDGVGYYSQVSKYSILQYAYNQLGKTAAGSSKQTLKDMLTAMLEYGAAAQIHFTYKTDRLANADYYQIKVDGGLLPDGFNKGLYLPGEKVTITAPETDGELVFIEWVNAAGESVSSDREYEITVGEQNETYTAVYVEPMKYSQGLEFTSNDDGTCYVSSIGTCTDTELHIPPFSPAGDTVVAIGTQAFSDCADLTNIRIPSTVSVIKNYAFSGCSSLIKVEIPNTVNAIGSGVFYECTSLASIKIPDGVVSIEGSTFYNCSALTNIVVPEDVTSIGNNAFYGCSSLQSITIPFVGASQESSHQHFGYIFGAPNDTMQSSYIPTGLTTIIITGGTRIGPRAFRGCTNLANISIPNSIVQIGTNAFSSCSSLTNVYISNIAAWCKISFYDESANPLVYAKNLYLNGELITNLVIPEGVTTIPVYAFRRQSSIKSVSLPSSLISIEKMAFYDCLGITSISIPNNVTKVADSAFKNCQNLATLSLGTGIITFGTKVFEECSNLTDIYITDILAWCNSSYGNYYYDHPLWYAKNLYLNNALITELIIPEGVTTIPNCAFRGQESIVSVTIPQSVTSIGYIAFDGNSNIKTLTIQNGVETIGTYAFSNCSSLSSVIIPNSVTTIGEFAFSGCSSLQSMSLPFAGASRNPDTTSHMHLFGYIFGTKGYDGGVETKQFYRDYYGRTQNITFYIPQTLKTVTIGYDIPLNSFYNCTGLENILFTENVTAIGASAFKYCSSLPSLTIPDSVTSIGSGAFGNCTALTSVTIGKNVATIPSSLFSGCTNLTSVTFSEGIAIIGDNSFSDCVSLTDLIFPNTVTKICEYAFYHCSALTNISISPSVKTIRQSAFSQCNNLTNIYITDIAAWCTIDFGDFPLTNTKNIFFNNKLISELIIPDGVLSINSRAFANCNHITSVTIPDSVTFIGETAFYKCSGITNVKIGTGVQIIETYAFQYCSNLTSVEILSAPIIEQQAFSYCNAALYTQYANGKYVGSEKNPYAILIETTNKNATSYEIHNDTIIIAFEAFRACTKLTSIAIPDSVQSISDSAFLYCSALATIAIGDNNPSYKNIDGNHIYTKDGSLLVQYAPGSDAAEFSIPESVQVIGNYAFFGSNNLTNVTIHNGVTNIGNRAFSNCGNLANVTIGTDVQTIGKYAFENCTNLTNAVFQNPEGWLITQYEDKSNSSSILASALLDSSAAATYLKSNYCKYLWYH